MTRLLLILKRCVKTWSGTISEEILAIPITKAQLRRYAALNKHFSNCIFQRFNKNTHTKRELMMRLTAILFGLLLLSSSVQAKKVYSETDYRPPDYDVGHPELITEAKVVLTEKELEKTVYNTPRKVADISISQQAINVVLQQAEALLPKQPIYRPGDGQTYGTPEAERDVIWWDVWFRKDSPILNLQIGVPELELRFDNLEIKSVAKQINRFEEDKRPITYIHLESLFLKVSIRVRGRKLEKIHLIDGATDWEVFTENTVMGEQFGLYRYTTILGGNDSITPDPEEVRKNLERYDQ